MASVKPATSLWVGQTLTAGAASIVSAAVDLAGGYGASVNVRLTNGGTAPTVAAQVQIEVSHNNSDWYNFGAPLIGNKTNSGVEEWGGIDIPPAVKYLRFTAGSNTGQDVMVDANLVELSTL